MKKFNIKYVSLFATPNFANLEYFYCTLDGVDKADVRKKFDSSFKNGEMIINIEESD